jgi:hypothetical protein
VNAPPQALPGGRPFPPRAQRRTAPPWGVLFRPLPGKRPALPQVPSPVPEHEPAEAARVIAEDFPTGPSAPSGRGRSVAGDLTRPDPNLTQAQLVVASPPPVALARLISADFPAGLSRRQPAPARASRPTGPPWGVPCSASPQAQPRHPTDIRALPRPPWHVHCGGGLGPEGVQR